MAHTGSTPLCAAAEMGQEAVVRLLLEKGANIDKATSEDGSTLLRIAAERAGYMALLLNNPGLPHHRDLEYVWESMTGCRYLFEPMRQFHFHDKIESDDDDGEMPMPTQNGYEAVVRVLLEKGANVDKVSDDGETPLHIAALIGIEAVVAALIGAGADINKMNYVGETPLHFAAVNGHGAVVTALIGAGADVNKRRDDGWTPVFCATINRHKSVVNTLIEAGARPAPRRDVVRERLRSHLISVIKGCRFILSVPFLIRDVFR
jgi:ankyrin repeat protein